MIIQMNMNIIISINKIKLLSKLKIKQMKKLVTFLLLVVLTLSSFGQTKTGTLKVFSELTGISVYLDDNKQGVDVKEVNGVPVGSHYLKVLLGTVSVYGDLVEIKEGQTTTVLIKNTGQVQEKIMDGKVAERQEYNNSKIEVVFSSNSVSQTTGVNSMYPGYYGYYGYSKSNTVTSQIADFKILKGGVKEIGDVALATVAGNQAILQRNAADNLRMTKMSNWGGGLFVGGLLIGGTIIADMLVKKPFLHPAGTDPGNFEIGAFVACVVSGTMGYYMIMNADKVVPDHYYNVDGANKDAQTYNRKLKEKLGLPESYDIK